MRRLLFTPSVLGRSVLSLSVVGLAVAGLAMTGCGDSGTDTKYAGDPDSNHLEPLGDAHCDSATRLTLVSMDDGTWFTVSETASNQWFCFTGGEAVGLDSQPGDRTEASLTDQGSLPRGGMFSLYVLPVDTPKVAVVVDDTGAEVPFAQASDGDHLMVLDVTAPDMGSELGEPVTFTLVDDAGNELLVLNGYR